MQRIALLASLLLASACDSSREAPVTSTPAAAATYHPVADIRQTMTAILDPAADVIWDSAGFIITADGETDLSPTTVAGWDRVVNAALVVAETGNLLLMPGRSAGPTWNAFASTLTAAGESALGAAIARDAQALFAAGGEIYQVCRDCHDRYMMPLEQAASTP
jgi:hypothetical protein